MQGKPNHAERDALAKKALELREQGLTYREIAERLGCGDAGRARYLVNSLEDRSSDKLCECGCGETTLRAPITRADRGVVKGQPFRFVRGHNAYAPAVERFWQKVDREGGIPEKRPDLRHCWRWTASLHWHGYALFYHERNGDRHGGRYGHRWAYEHFVGPIPPGFSIDHLCSNRACVNPSHLEAVTPAENSRRATAKVTPEQMAEIRGSKRSLRDLAAAYGLDVGHISRLRSGRRGHTIVSYRRALREIASGAPDPIAVAQRALAPLSDRCEAEGYVDGIGE